MPALAWQDFNRGLVMQNQVNPKYEIALAIGLIVFSIIVYIASLSLPEPEYEPLGSAALPQGLAVVMSFLCLIMLARAIPRLKTFEAKVDPNPEVIPRPWISAGVFFLTVVFVGVLDFGILSFVPAGIIYLTGVGFLLTHRSLKQLPWVIAFSVVVTVSSFLLFTKMFYIDLP
ncbi:MAG: tripartite tricarboxylate transporter TctB family protein [Methyloligellaceae bacterium]